MGLFSRTRGCSKRSGTQADTPSPKKGLLRGWAKGGGWLNNNVEYHWTAEVTEIERIGDLSKLKFGEISGADKEMLLEVIPVWWPTKDVIWKADDAVTDLVKNILGGTAGLVKSAPIRKKAKP